MGSWWVRFERRAAGCIDADTEHEARMRAEAIVKDSDAVLSVDILPYPASPRLHVDPSAVPYAFCIQPTHCAGRSSCPRHLSCTE